MIRITKINDVEVVINTNLIEMIEATPDTTITMTTGRKVIAKESIDDVIDRIIEYKRRVKEIDFDLDD